MKIEILGVYLVDFKQNFGGEFSGKHYALVISEKSKKDNTLLVAIKVNIKIPKKFHLRIPTFSECNFIFNSIRRTRNVKQIRVM